MLKNLCFCPKREIQIDEQENIVLASLSLEGTIATNDKFEKYMKKLFKYVEAYPPNPPKPLILDLSACTLKEERWKWLLDFLSANAKIFRNIDSLDFCDSPLTLRQLQDFYDLFQQCRDGMIRFPDILIDQSQAASQLFQKGMIKKNKFPVLSVEQLKREEPELVCEYFDNQEEPNKDISREEFRTAITHYYGVDREFTNHIKLLKDEGKKSV